MNQLALLCKTRGQLGDLRQLLLRHKQQQVLVRLEDRHGASAIMESMQSDSLAMGQRQSLMERLRKAHTANRETYRSSQDSSSEESEEVSRLNRRINDALQTISELEKSNYTADILNRRSNRAMRANVVSSAENAVHLARLDLSDEVDAYRSTCSICCGEEQIMSVSIKRLASAEENTTDFALNFPLAAGLLKHNADMISSQVICFQCSLLLSARSIYQENIVAALPTVMYVEANRKYLNHQLTLAMTGGLATGVSGQVQLFATILDRTLETKTWCSKDNKDSEAQARRDVFEWMLLNLLQNSECRMNFSETGKWVPYPEAVNWAFDQYSTERLDSWIIQYPLAGFNQILRWAETLQLSVSGTVIETVRDAKLIHFVATVLMRGLLTEKDGDRSWTYPFLRLIYREFNAPGIPQDQGRSTLVSSSDLWSVVGEILGGGQDVQRFLAYFHGPGQEAVRSRLARRIQILTFWSLFTQKGHTTPKTLFSILRAREPLATAVLDPQIVIPTKAVEEILMSIFYRSTEASDGSTARDIHADDFSPPFATPFGASVLHCGYPRCGVSFYFREDGGPLAAADGIRTRRAKHFNDIFGGKDSQTGLPEPTAAPTAPTSNNNTLHISMARVWFRLNLNERKAIAAKENHAVAAFLDETQHEICATSHRGNIYMQNIKRDILSLLPSFLE
ncbi:MAG: hypothetical protein Q9174_006760, partial [Haloplaca sp. 1 TL-2023]